MTDALRGWDSDLRRFASTPTSAIVSQLEKFLADSSIEQQRAWRESIPHVQREAGELVNVDGVAGKYTAILEYQLPLELRRADAILLMHDAIVVIELKGKSSETEADLDQAHAYARDLRAYHAACEDRDVYAVLVPTLASGRTPREIGGVYVCPPAGLDELLLKLNEKKLPAPVNAETFLSEESYRPLPTLVKAARELFEYGTLRRVKRAAARTEAATDCLLALVHAAAAQKRRKLVLLSGVPGAGKTLVGLRLVHSPVLDDLAVAREAGRPTAPAVFLSGNGPLVEVLSYELRGAGAGGRTFVRGVKAYMQRHLRGVVPAEHVLVYDEAQRAYDAAMVAEKHDHSVQTAKSEPEHFIEFAERIPDWCVVVALIGGGQEIHKGEEGGTGQWATALRAAKETGRWDVHGPTALSAHFGGMSYQTHYELNLDRSLRSHLAFEVHKFVGQMVDMTRANSDVTFSVAERRPGYAGGSNDQAEAANEELGAIASRIAQQGHRFRITRDLNAAKKYLRDRYVDDPAARYGLLASSRDRDLVKFGVNNDFQSTKRTKFGPWYGDDEADEGGRSCRHMRECVTEFGAQGLELDGVLLAWGTDFVLKQGKWNVEKAARYQRTGTPVRNPAQLRANAYRVLLTRARDATVAFLPPLPELNETYEFLVRSGFEPLQHGSSQWRD